MNRSGFTLIELVIALSVMAITLAIAGPSLDRYSKSQDVKNTAREIYSNLQLARITAIRENIDVYAIFTLSAGSEALNIDRDTDGVGGPDGTQTSLVQNVDFSSKKGSYNIQLTNSFDDENETTITYQNDGTAAGNQTITLSHDDPEVDTKYSLIINMSGGISLTKIIENNG